MRHRVVVQSLTAVLLAAALAACTGPGKKQQAEGEFPPPSEVGLQFLDGKVELVSQVVPEKAGDVGTFTVRSNTDEELRNLIGTVIYYYDPDPGSMAKRASESHPTRFDLLGRGGEVTLEAKLQESKLIRSVEIAVENIESKSTIARTDATRGSMFLGGRLEVVKIYDQLSMVPPRISFAVMNLSDRKVTDAQFKVILHREGEVVWDPGDDWEWFPADVEPGQAIAVEPDLEGFSVDEKGLPRPVLLVRLEY